MVVLERLSPDQRVAFVLHDGFAVPFAEVAAVLGTNEAAARQLASRARKAVSASRRHNPIRRTTRWSVSCWRPWRLVTWKPWWRCCIPM